MAVDGMDAFATACSTEVRNGMSVKTNSPEIRQLCLETSFVREIVCCSATEESLGSIKGIQDCDCAPTRIIVGPIVL